MTAFGGDNSGRPTGSKRKPGNQLPGRAGFTLLELMLVLVFVSILAALVLPNTPPTACEQLDAAARILATDLAYGRGLAVSTNSQYRFTWDTANNRYLFSYSGSNPALATLPAWPLASPSDTPTQRVVAFGSLPQTGLGAQLVGAAAQVGSSYQAVSTLDFGPLGATVSSSPTTIWLSAGSGNNIRYTTLGVNPVTGLVTVGPYTATGPPAGVFGH
jgi:prepilin-type N-terminal cleavage/methylation domain-containing protein